MARPTSARLVDLRRVKAWPLISFAILWGRLRPDTDLVVAKDLGGLSATARLFFAADFAAARQAATRLGWSYYWSRSVIDQFVPAVLEWCGAKMSELTEDDLAAPARAQPHRGLPGVETVRGSGVGAERALRLSRPRL
jgi:hypothetical protein